MSNAPIANQIGLNQPIPSGLDVITSPLYPPQTLLFRLRSFSPEVFDLSPQSHLMRLMGVILGDAGGEQARKRSMVNRLRMAMSSTSFLDLDAFWGSLAGINRTPAEVLPTNPTTGRLLNPYVDSAPLDIWTTAHQADASYRDRISQFVRALQNGASPVGIRGVAEAILSCPVDLYEDFSSGTTYKATIVPHRPLALSEVYNLKSIIDKIKPAQSRVDIDQGGTQPNLGVPLPQAWGSSNYWQILATITPGPFSLFEAATVRPSFPYSQYQGESWCINDAIATIQAELWDTHGNVLNQDSFEHYVWPDGTFTNYSPSLSVQPQWEVDLGRLAQSGVISANPLTIGAELSPILIDGMDPVELKAALASTGLSFQVTNHDYWSTPARLPDGTTDAITYSLDQLHYVDSVSFEVANFPHIMTLQIEDPVAGGWVDSFSQTIGSSSPQVLGNPLADQLVHQHPQHSGSNSWIPMTVRFTPAKVQNIRLVLTRIKGRGPVNSSGEYVPYSLGVRNLVLQMIIDSPNLLPVGGGDIDTVTNVLKDQVTYSVYQENPNAPIYGEGQWRCSPQVSSQAVVNYYLDSRTSTGQPQVIDSFYVEPTHQGVHCTVYWSNDEPVGPGDAQDDILPVTYNGGIQPSPTGLAFDSRLGSTITVPHTLLRYSQAMSWWAGISFYANPTEPIYKVFSFGSNVVQVNVQTGNVTLTTAAGDSVLVGNVAFTSNASNSIVVGYVAPEDLASSDIVGNANGAFYLLIQDPGDATLHPTALPADLADDIVIGDPNAGSGVTLSNFVFKGEALTTAVANDYVAGPKAYCDKGTFYGQSIGKTVNAYARFDPSFITSLNKFGFVGGVPDITANINWTPVTKDFVLTKGNILVPPTRAKFWKFEMTNLVPEPYSVYMPQVPVTTQMMSSSAVAPGSSSSGYRGAVPSGTTTQITSSQGESAFGRSTIPVTPGSDPRVSSPTSTLVAPTPNASQTLASRFLNFGYLSWAQPMDAPVDASGGQENYLEMETSQIQQVAFFCGFTTVQANRTNIAAKIDTPSYMESFLDQINWEFTQETQPVWTPGSLSSSQGAPAQAVSYPYYSYHNVDGIQFASVQSLPVELIPNDQFQDSAHYSTYNWSNPNDFTQTGDATISFDPLANVAIVTRVATAAVTPAHGLIRPPVAPVMAEPSQMAVDLIGGGIKSPVFTPSVQGVCYIAAKVVPIQPLSNPVLLQLLNANNGTVLAQWPMSGGVGQRMQSIYQIMIGQYAPSGTPLQLALVQEDDSANAWAVEGLSFFDEGIFWEFSCDGGNSWYPGLGIRNNQYGILRFSNPSNQLLWRVTFYQPGMTVSAVELRPLYQGDSFIANGNVGGGGTEPMGWDIQAWDTSTWDETSAPAGRILAATSAPTPGTPFMDRGYGYRGPTLEFTDSFASIWTDPLFDPRQAILPRTSYNPIINRDQVGIPSGPIPVVTPPPPPVVTITTVAGSGLPFTLPSNPAR